MIPKPLFYSPAPRPHDEEARQRAVDAAGFEQAIDNPMLVEIVRQAALLFEAPIAAISIVDRDRQWFPARFGLDARETSRAASFCAHAIHTPDRPFCVPDAPEDARFAGNPLVLGGPEIRFYVGAPLVDAGGQPLGALCVLDNRAQPYPSIARLEALAMLAKQVLAVTRSG
jgi:GAF domain-containing protein